MKTFTMTSLALAMLLPGAAALAQQDFSQYNDQQLFEDMPELTRGLNLEELTAYRAEMQSRVQNMDPGQRQALGIHMDNQGKLQYQERAELHNQDMTKEMEQNRQRDQDHDQAMNQNKDGNPGDPMGNHEGNAGNGGDGGHGDGGDGGGNGGAGGGDGGHGGNGGGNGGHGRD